MWNLAVISTVWFIMRELKKSNTVAHHQRLYNLFWLFNVKKNVVAQKGVEKHCSRLSQVVEAVYKISVLLPFVQIFFATDFNVYVITLKPHTILLVYLPLSSHPTSSIRSVHALRQITGMMRMNWAMMGGSNRLVFVLSLSVFPWKTCSTRTWDQAQEVGTEWNLPFEIMLTKSSYLVSQLALHPESSVHIPIEATRHFKGLDVLSRAHATGTLSDDSCQPHLLLHIYLFIKKQK